MLFLKRGIYLIVIRFLQPICTLSQFVILIILLTGPINEGNI